MESKEAAEMPRLNVGGHLSLGRKPEECARWAAENGFSSMQIFASSPGAWKPPIADPARDDEVRQSFARYGIDPLVIHSIYLINLASEQSWLVERSIGSLIATLNAGRAMNAAAVVTHIGSHGGRGYDAIAERTAAALHRILEQTPGGIDLALENSAGAGGIIGSELSEIGDLIRRAESSPRLKLVVDTAHLFAAGWNFGAPGVPNRLVEEIDRQVGLDRLLVIHANDSAQPLGSRKDRHANIGEGFIGLEGFRALLREEPLRAVPWILETPDLERRVEDRARLEALAIPDVEPEVALGA